MGLDTGNNSGYGNKSNLRNRLSNSIFQNFSRDKEELEGKEFKLNGDFELYVGCTIFRVKYNEYSREYRFTNRDDKTFVISPGQKKIIGKGGNFKVEKHDKKASNKHIEVRVDDEGNIVLKDISGTREGFFYGNGGNFLRLLINLSKIDNMISYIKTKNPNTTFDNYAYYELASLEKIEYVGNVLLKGVVEGGKGYKILNVNKLGTDYIYAEKVGENEYIIHAGMPHNSNIAGISFIKLLECLPKGAKIYEKQSLSVNSFINIIGLFKRQERFNIRVSLQDEIWLNDQGKHGPLAQLIKEKSVGEDPLVFETNPEENAREIADGINELIKKYIRDGTIHAEVKEIEKEGGVNSRGIKFPGFTIEKL